MDSKLCTLVLVVVVLLQSGLAAYVDAEGTGLRNAALENKQR